MIVFLLFLTLFFINGFCSFYTESIEVVGLNGDRTFFYRGVFENLSANEVDGHIVILRETPFGREKHICSKHDSINIKDVYGL